MARPIKRSLLYFNVDVDIFDDEKIIDISMTYGPLGEAVFWRLFCWAYSSENGYYYEFTSLDSLATKLIKSIGNKWARDKKTVVDIILYLGEINLFSAELIQRNVITSRGLQRRYLKATERRQSIIDKYNLLEKNDYREGLLSAPKNNINVAETAVNAAETSVNADNNATKKSKEKIKERKGNMSTDGGAKILTDEEFKRLCELSSVGSVCKYVSKLNDWQKRNNKRCKDPFGTIKTWIEQDGQKQADSHSYDLDDIENFALNYGLDGGAKGES